MLYRYVIGVRYVICNIIIDVSYELFMDGTGGGGSERNGCTRPGRLDSRREKVGKFEAEYFKRFV